MIKQFRQIRMLTDELGKIADMKIENGKVKFTIPARTAAIFTVK